MFPYKKHAGNICDSVYCIPCTVIILSAVIKEERNGVKHQDTDILKEKGLKAFHKACLCLIYGEYNN